MRLATFFLTTIILVAANVVAREELVDKTWYMTSINSTPISLEEFTERKPELLLDSQNRVTAWAGCNQLVGTYELDGKEIKFSKIASTMMMCDGKMEFEQEFIKALEDTAYWDTAGHGQTLNLESANLAIVAVFNDSPTYP